MEGVVATEIRITDARHDIMGSDPALAVRMSTPIRRAGRDPLRDKWGLVEGVRQGTDLAYSLR